MRPTTLTIKEGTARVRFAPSPTGPFHIGNLRSALFNFLFAKKYQGKMILRIEDTDKERSEKQWEEGIQQALKWVGITWDEGPFYQSQRTEIYKQYLEKLLRENKAYFCFCSQEDLETQKQYLMSIGKAPVYPGKCKTISQGEIENNLKQGRPFVVRLRTSFKRVTFNDLVLGEIATESHLLGDFVIAKSFSEPLYNFACVVDDFEMKISHVIRGGDHISNTPKQILLAEALGIKPPIYIHLPLVLGNDRSKLSKRHDATFIPEYAEQGYLPEAMVNFLAFLGWNPGNDREIFSLSELQDEFSVEKIQKSPAVFNQDKLDWLNGFYIRKKPLNELALMCQPYLIKAGFNANNLEYVQKAVDLYQERLKKLSEISELTGYLFQKEIAVDKTLLKWKDMSEKEIKASLEKSYKALKKIKEWTQDNITSCLLELSSKARGDRGSILWPLRVALSGKKASAGPFEIAFVLGKEKTLNRIKQAVGSMTTMSF